MRPRSAPQREITTRDLEILKDVILTHLLSAGPVSSRTVSRFGGTDLSAATIRNVMADLEDWGYLSQPHTSAGRVPTTAGYHLFIDALMDQERLPERDRRRIEEHLLGSSGDAERLMEGASTLLSDLSSQVSIVVAPALGQTVLETIDFVPLTGNKVLCVVVSTGGFIDNKVIETDQPVSREKLVRISNYLTENYAGRTLSDIRDHLIQRMAEDRAKMDRLLGLTIELARKGLEDEGEPDVRVGGTTTVLSHPELADVQRVRRLFDTFADKARLVSLLNQHIGGEGVRVLIGEESDLTSELDFGLVATTYGPQDVEARGTLGIFGPARMEYQRVIPLVQFLGQTLSKALADNFPSSDYEER